jgi:hydrogenase/urease accessory protein HupE
MTQAHESRPLFIEVVETAEGVFTLQYKIASSVPDFNLPDVLLPETFQALDKLSVYQTNDGFVKKQKFQSESTGVVYNHLLSPEEMEWVVPDKETKSGVAKQYTVLGIQHILEGWDHLLFLICLIFVAGTGRKMLITITGFTIAHSITLILASLNVVRVPIPPVEAVIALSVVFLATEIAIKNKNSLTYKYPIAVSSSFGLLHGFGFASVLSDIGLPQIEIPTSLLFFNVGVEIGQIIFLLVVILIYFIYRKIKVFTNSGGLEKIGGIAFEKISAYAVGSIASFWMIERLYGFF